jgi:hypothetical protein
MTTKMSRIGGDIATIPPELRCSLYAKLDRSALLLSMLRKESRILAARRLAETRRATAA